MASRKRPLYMLPGPCNVHRSVERAGAILLPHTDPRFKEAFEQTRDFCRFVLEAPDNLETYPMDVSATSTRPGMMNNLMRRGSHVVALNAGVFGRLFTRNALELEASMTEICAEAGDTVRPEQVEEVVRQQPVDVLCAVAVETSTGQQQPMRDISRIVKMHHRHALVLLDAVTLAGAAHVDTAGDCGTSPPLSDVCDAVFTAAQKGLGGNAGASIMSYGPEAARYALETRHAMEPPVHHATSLKAIKESREQGTFHHTWSAPALFSLKAALERVKGEGLERRYQRHEISAGALETGLKALGIEYFGRQHTRAPMLHAVNVPQDVSGGGAAIMKGLRDDHNVHIAPGLADLKDQILRIGVMGENASGQAVLRLLRSLGQVLKQLGHDCDPHAGHREARRFYEEQHFPPDALLEPLP